MRLHDSSAPRAVPALAEGVSAALPAPPRAGTVLEEFFRRSQNGSGWRILRANTERDERGERRAAPSAADRRMKLSSLDLSSRTLWFTATIAVMVLAIASALVYELVSVADDPLLARQVGWNLLFIGLSAGGLAAGAAWWVVRRITLPLRRLAETMSEMARTGQLRSDFPTAGGGGEVRLIEETLRALTVSL